MEQVLIRIAISACGFLLFGLISVHGPWGAERIENRLRTAAQERLDKFGFEWAHVEADGQRLVLSGVAPNDVRRIAAVELTQESLGPGGVAIGGVTVVEANFTPAFHAAAPAFTPLADFRFAATFAGRQMLLSGMMPSEAARKALLAAIESAQIAVSDKTTMAALADEASWLSAAEAALQALLMLDEGQIRQESAAFALTGLAPDDTAADAAESLAAGAAGAFAFAVEIERPAAAPSVEELSGACQAAINRAQNGRRLTFRPNSAWLSESDHAFLDQLSGEISACGGLTIAIEGHTDSVGAAEGNLALSRRRAEAVQAYLQSAGAEASYIVKAYGETRPIASNRTAAGQKSNRRIDFVVAADEMEAG